MFGSEPALKMHLKIWSILPLKNPEPKTTYVRRLSTIFFNIFPRLRKLMSTYVQYLRNETLDNRDGRGENFKGSPTVFYCQND